MDTLLVKPFYVMKILERAKELEKEGRDVIHFEVGEPDMPVPEKVKLKAIEALRSTELKYTESTGIEQLKERIANFYSREYGVKIDRERVIITPGSSPALLAVLKIVGERIGGISYTDPGYPCYRNMLSFLKMRGEPLILDNNDFRIEPEKIKTPAIIINSPSNPTGKILKKEELKKLSEKCFLISDEIYHGITYGERATSALEVTDKCAVINGFSKFFLMTGWRVGWAVVPEWMVEDLRAILQNVVISPPTLSQLAAIHCFDEEVMEELRENVKEFKRRRDLMLKGLKELGFKIPVEPEGAFYIYTNVSEFTENSYSFASELLEKANVAVTPGIDFGEHNADKFVRFSYCTKLNRIEDGLERIHKFLKTQSLI